MEDDEATPELQPSRYLLPPGCKDLIDVLRRARSSSMPPHDSEPGSHAAGHWKSPAFQEHLADLLPPVGTTPAVVYLPDTVEVKELAQVLGQKPFLLVAVLMVLGRFASLQEHLTFEEAASVCAQFGTVAERTA